MSETQQTQTEEPRLIANRYRVIEKIGQGSMGTVYKVHDRLTHQAVALKQVTMSQPPPEIALNTLTSGTVDMRIALAQEFKTLATLRHPRIISVLDYGFVADLGEEFGLPFFTMELLESAQDIVTFGRSNHWISELELLMQLLQALAYLHRRGIVHRDLKPSNVLVVNGQVKVLDFGLAFVRAYGKESQATPVVGTLAYMAPETLRGVAPNEISDLYSVGVIAYQMFAGEHPFDVDDMTQFIEDLLNTEPDLSRLDTMPEIIEIIGRLLSKDPARRFASANDVLNAIRAATGQTIILDSTTRESYLQAARFVGRSEELATLTVALHQAMNRLGSSWLVAGESGVGKSRLLDELRTQALVSGCIVLRGESVPGPGLPYKLWRESLRRMLLMIEISALEASILKEIIPGLPELIGRDIPDASRIEGQPGQLRLVNTIVDVFKRTTQPVILLLEDLHWSIESLEPLKALAQNAHNLPLMIVGTYRDDERPDLPDELPEMKPIKLERLSPDEIAELSESMLGEVGRQGEIVGLLQRETEGNTFFIVEVVRALAEQAGDLENVGVTTLPDQVFTGGVRAFVQRRLDRVPEDARPLLHLAAVAGRRINLEVMQAAIDSLPEDERYDLNRWLTNCADAAVLMIQEETWHFAHDKLREALLETIEPDELPSLHRQVAHGIETAYPDDETRSVSLVEHWRAGGNVEKTINHAIIAAERALLVGAFEEGKKLLLSVLESMDDKLSTSHRLSLLILLGAMFWRTSDYDEGALYYAESLALAYEIDDKANIARALNGLSFIDTLREDYATARERSQLALSFAEQADDPLSSARALSNLGVVAESDSDYDSAHAYYERSLAIFREQGDQRGIASVLNNLGSIADSQGRIEEASQYYNESLEICRAIDFRHGIATLLNNLGILYERQNNLQQAGKTYLESLSISEAIGDRRGCAHSYTNLSFVSIALEEYDQARHHVESALHITHSLEISYIMPHVLVAYAWLYLIDGAPEFSAEIVGSILQIDALDEDFCNLRLNPLLERLDATLPPEKHEAAIKQGSIQPIHKMIKVVLDRISSAG